MQEQRTQGDRSLPQTRALGREAGQARGSLGRQPATLTSIRSILSSRDGNPARDSLLASLLSGGNEGWGEEDRSVVTGMCNLEPVSLPCSTWGLKLN